MVNAETPMRASLHWDDILRQFSVTVSAEFDTPAGHFEPGKVRITAADLATALAFIVNYWTGGIGTRGGIENYDFELGSLSDLKAQFDAAWQRVPV